MKTLLIILVSVTLSLGVSAQHRVYYQSYHPRVYISPFSYGLGFGYPYLGYPYLGYPYYGSPYGPNYGNRMPYKLSLQIQSIKIDYKNQIREARKDKSLSHSKRREEIRSLKSERDEAIIDAQRNYRRPSRMNNQNPGTNNNQNPGKGNSSSGDNSYNQGS
jgi:hypothetical protein